ncbi:TPA: nucleotidyltransferase domain-containing protein, partial [Vibrio vulnificus]|nr:nucleotidyltransferase domain-containing protein [Vibrio vulnificus]
FFGGIMGIIANRIIEYLQRKNLLIRGERYDQELVNELIKQLMSAPNGELKSVYLYGSRARGNYWMRSDHDFYVVFEDGMPDFYDTSHVDHFHMFNGPISKTLKAKNLSTNFDLMVVDESKWDNLAKMDGTHVQQCLEFGIKLYERT